MYNPIKDGIKKDFSSVLYKELKPPIDLNEYVHSYWELKTDKDLDEDFHFHVIPDACINILFNIKNIKVAAITYRKTEYVELNLGKSFHYRGIQLLPGVWNSINEEIKYGFVDTPYTGDLPLIEVGEKLLNSEYVNNESIFSDLIRTLISKGIIKRNLITERILSDINEIDSVEEMAASANLSPRQLQRKLKETTGFSPHDFLKILRLQLAFRNGYLDYYVDQSHFINNFKKITGYTPKEYFKTFDV